MPVETIRRANRDDIPALSELFTEVFGLERPDDVWRWKYFDHPGGTYSHVVEAGGRLVAHCGGTPIVMQDAAKRYLALQSVDFMSSRKHTGGMGRGGVFARMVDAFFAEHSGTGGVEMVYGFPGERHRLLGEKILRYSSIEPVGELTLEPGEAKQTLEPLELRNLALLSQTSVRFGGVRDEAYLRWRYLDHPLHQYGMVSVTRWPWRRPSVTAIVRESGSELFLMEVIGDLQTREGAALVGDLRRFGRTVTAWGPLAHRRSRILLEAGFSGSERPHRVEVRFFNGRVLPTPGELYYSLGDYDVD